MRRTADIWFYAIVSLMCVALVLVIIAAILGIADQSQDYERGYMDGFRDGQNMQCNYGTVKVERGEK